MRSNRLEQEWSLGTVFETQREREIVAQAAGDIGLFST